LSNLVGVQKRGDDGYPSTNNPRQI